MATHYSGANKVLKSLFETRWFARVDASNALPNGYNHIAEASTLMASNGNQSGGKRNEVQSRAKEWDNWRLFSFTVTE